jgi:hypothetical protein
VHGPLQNDGVTPDTRRRERGEESCTYVLCCRCRVRVGVCQVPGARWEGATDAPVFLFPFVSLSHPNDAVFPSPSRDVAPVDGVLRGVAVMVVSC